MSNNHNYTILVKYETGDSFGSEMTSCEVGTFHSLEEAQSACEDILEHYRYAKESNYSEEYLKRVSKKSWYHKYKEFHECAWRFTMKTQGQIIGVEWTGYFETLISLHIQDSRLTDYYL